MVAARAYEDDARPGWLAMTAWPVLALLPDTDVVGFALGVHYEDPWGHRGATHSLAFAIAGAVISGFAAHRWFNRPFARTLLFATIVLASHGLLDTLTDGGLGAALFWPFDLTRYFARWRPILVAPIGLDFFSPFGAMVMASEAILFLPLFVYALAPAGLRRRRIVVSGLFAVWLVTAWLVASSDPVRDAVITRATGAKTIFANGYTDAAFGDIAIGMSGAEVRQRLGAPLGEGWLYQVASERACALVRFTGGTVVESREPGACRGLGIDIGVSAADVVARLGNASDECWEYSASGQPAGIRAAFRLRVVCFTNAHVVMVGKR